MPLTLNQFLLLVLTIAAVIAVVFLVSLITQLRKTAREGEKALAEIQALTKNLNETTDKVQSRIDDIEEVLQSAKKTTAGLAETTKFITQKIVRPSSKYWPFIAPVIRLGWRQLKKRKKQKEE